MCFSNRIIFLKEEIFRLIYDYIAEKFFVQPDKNGCTKYFNGQKKIIT